MTIFIVEVEKNFDEGCEVDSLWNNPVDAQLRVDWLEKNKEALHIEGADYFFLKIGECQYQLPPKPTFDLAKNQSTFSEFDKKADTDGK